MQKSSAKSCLCQLKHSGKKVHADNRLIMLSAGFLQVRQAGTMFTDTWSAYPS